MNSRFWYPNWKISSELLKRSLVSHLYRQLGAQLEAQLIAHSICVQREVLRGFTCSFNVIAERHLENLEWQYVCPKIIGFSKMHILNACGRIMFSYLHRVLGSWLTWPSTTLRVRVRSLPSSTNAGKCMIVYVNPKIPRATTCSFSAWA